MKKTKMKDEKDEHEHESLADQDPFIQLGFAINAQFDMMIQLAYMMLFLTVCSIPMFYIYKEGNRIDTTYNPFKIFNLGNLGASTTLCTNL